MSRNNVVYYLSGDIRFLNSTWEQYEDKLQTELLQAHKEQRSTQILIKDQKYTVDFSNPITISGLRIKRYSQISEDGTKVRPVVVSYIKPTLPMKEKCIEDFSIRRQIRMNKITTSQLLTLLRNVYKAGINQMLNKKFEIDALRDIYYVSTLKSVKPINYETLLNKRGSLGWMYRRYSSSNNSSNNSSNHSNMKENNGRTLSDTKTLLHKNEKCSNIRKYNWVSSYKECIYCGYYMCTKSGCCIQMSTSNVTPLPRDVKLELKTFRERTKLMPSTAICPLCYKFLNQVHKLFNYSLDSNSLKGGNKNVRKNYKKPNVSVDLFTESNVEVDPLRVTKLSEDVQKYVSSGTLPMLGVYVTRNCKKVVSISAGTINKNTKKPLPLASDSILRFYSMTKAMTAVVAMQLIEERLISLDDSVSQHLSVWDDSIVTVQGNVSPHRAITIRDLLSHTSGITYHNLWEDGEESTRKLYKKVGLDINLFSHHAADPPCKSLRDFAKKLNRIPLVCQPGEKYEYSASIDLLGALIEEKCSSHMGKVRSLGDEMRTRIFEPLGLQDTAFTLPTNKLRRLAECYQLHRNFADSVEYKLAPNGVGVANKTSLWHTKGQSSKMHELLHSGGGGLLSTADDYLKFATCLANGGELDGHRLLQPKTFSKMRVDQLSIIGAKSDGKIKASHGFGILGEVVTKSCSSKECFSVGSVLDNGAFGWGGSAGTFFFVDPENHLACVITSQLLGFNVCAPNIRERLTRAVYELFPDLSFRKSNIKSDVLEVFPKNAMKFKNQIKIINLIKQSKNIEQEKNKKVRKHKGIYQTGPKKGKLKPGFKYSGKKTKTGLKIIIKVKK